MEVDLPAGATPLDPDEAEGLIPSLSTQGELNEFEALNILEGTAWANKSMRIKASLLDEGTFRELHRRMFGDTWKWAGRYRTTQKSIGCEAWQISMMMKNLGEDVKVWIKAKIYPPAEIAARFHHRLVWIHPFPNGNGRFARLATDLLCEQQGWRRSKWGSADLCLPSETRRSYIEALRAADSNNFGPIIEFMSR